MRCRREPARAQGSVVARLLCRCTGRPPRLQGSPPKVSDPVATLKNRSGVQSAQSAVGSSELEHSIALKGRWRSGRRRGLLSTLNHKRVLLSGVSTATKRLWAHTVSYRTPPTHHPHTSQHDSSDVSRLKRQMKIWQERCLKASLCRRLCLTGITRAHLNQSE